jgi:hypothetical protein
MRNGVFFAHTTVDGCTATAADALWQRFPWGDEEMAFTNADFHSQDPGQHPHSGTWTCWSARGI